MKTSNFYCQIKCGEVDFSIEEWNKAFKEIMDMPISEAEKEKLLNPEPCKEQCFDCIAIVAETKRKNFRQCVSCWLHDSQKCIDNLECEKSKVQSQPEAI